MSNAAGFAEPASTQLFKEVPTNHAFYEGIQRLARRGYISGYACGGAAEPCNVSNQGNLPYFRPGSNATRGQISRIVSNTAGFQNSAGPQLFNDLQLGSAFYDFVKRLTNRGIMSGYACGGEGEPCNASGLGALPYFRPNNNATRGQVAKIVANTFFPDCQTP
ncbi:MAG TPA: S-layer homology domain-containing protein [Chloroflexia bacterium]